MLRPPRTLAACLLAAAVALAGCTSGSSTPAPGPSDSSSSRTPSADPTTGETPTGAPTTSAPTTAAAATSCPFLTKHFVHPTIGQRLGRLTVLRSAGRTVGCRFYAYQGAHYNASENLPGPNQPSVEVTTQQWGSSAAAHNAFVRLGQGQTNDQSAPVPGAGVTGVCFQDDFDPHDHGQDWTCAVNHGSTEVVVRTVDTTGTTNTLALLGRVLRGL